MHNKAQDTKKKTEMKLQCHTAKNKSWKQSWTQNSLLVNL